ncbi:MAG: hypothetical protein IKP61_00190 [Spirochaetales bacterium]|nr:hypothetical protein [Spirochaetales bacterium]MBR6084020.1 hypothetical protein [Spirochaetales bacterium]
MKKILFTIAMLSLIICCSVFAEDLTSSTVTVASIVQAPLQVNPSIIIGIGSAELSSYVSPETETTVITGLNLMKDGTFTFALMTSEEINIVSNNNKMSLQVEIIAEGFHLYDYDYTGIMEGSSMDEANIKERNAVPLLSTTPEIEIPQFYGSNENVTVNHISPEKNKINIQFNKGVTKADLILGTFNVAWEGKRPLDAGIYKAKVSVIYSTN